MLPLPLQRLLPLWFLLLLLLHLDLDHVVSFSLDAHFYYAGRGHSGAQQAVASMARSSPPPRTKQSSGALHGQNASSGDEVVTLVHSHHLLDHKPDNLILAGKKFKLRGVACLGRPGVALCIGSRRNADKFLGKLKSAMPQKKFGTVDLGDRARGDAGAVALGAIAGFGEVAREDLRKVLLSIGAEDTFYKITGSPQNSNTMDTGSNEDGRMTGAGKSTAVKKKRKKRG